MLQNKIRIEQKEEIKELAQQQQSLLKKLKIKISQLMPCYEQKKQKKLILSKKLKETLQKKEFYLQEKNLQEKKYKSLNLLVNQLQLAFEKQIIEIKSKQLLISDDQDSNIALQNHLLRQELIKINESCKQDQKLNSFLKQLELNKNNLNNFVAKSNYIENQAQLLAQIHSQLKALQNPNLQCRRKWVSLYKEKQKNEKDLKIYKIQIQRQNQLLKSLYEEYLEKINTSKAKIVNFNQTQRQKVLTEYLVQEVAVIQQKRREVEDENRNLHFHFQQLADQMIRIESQNRQLNSFFLNDNRTEQSKLALKMKGRIQQLRDNLAEIQNKNCTQSILNKKNSNLQYVRNKLLKLKQANDFLELKSKNAEDGKFTNLDEKQISQFFTQILNSKQQKCQMIKERCGGLNAQLRQLSMKELLLQNQNSNIQQVLKQNNYQLQYNRKQILRNNSYQ